MKNQDIEKLRGFAIFSVLLQHLPIMPSVFELLNLNSQNMPFYLGVELFFVISGYVVTKSFFAKQLNLKLFYAKRFFRILPLVIFFLISTTIINQLILYYNGFFAAPWDAFSLEALAILGSYYTNIKNPFVYYNGAMWSLSVEMQFYLVFPLFLLILSRLKILKPYFSISIFLSIYLLISVFIRFIVPYWKAVNLPYIFHYVSIWKFDFLILGVLVYFFSILPSISSYFIEFQKNYLKSLSIGLILGTYLISYLMGSASAPSNLLNSWGYLMFGICFFFTLLIASLDKDLFTFNPIFDKFTEYLGSRSYSLYVLHFPAIVIVWKVIFNFFPFINKFHPVYYGVVQLLLFILIGLPLSEFAFRYIERPGIAIGQILIKKYNLG